MNDPLYHSLIQASPSMSEDDFWASENAIQRARVLQNPEIMAATLEMLQRTVVLLQEQITELQQWQKQVSEPQLTK